MSRTVAVTGATGFVGRYVVAELLSRGIAVRGLVRSRDKARDVLPKDDALHLIQGDALDEEAIGSLVGEGEEVASAVINTLGIIREGGGGGGKGQTFQRIHVQSVELLVAAARRARARRIVHVSALGVQEEGKTEYQRSKWRGEVAIANSGIPWTILRCSTIHGRDGEFVQLVKEWVRGKKAPWFFLPFFSRSAQRDDAAPIPPLAPVYYEPALVAPVAVEDVAWAAAECLERDETIGEIYNICGPETLTWPEMLVLFRSHIPNASKNLHPVGIPATRAAMLAKIAGRMGLAGLLPFDEGMAIMGAQDNFAEMRKVREHLDFQPIAFSERMPQYAGEV